MDGQTKEAIQFWGDNLFKQDKCGTELLDRLLAGIAGFISAHFEPYDGSDLTPSQLAAFYRAVDGDYDPLFVDTPPPSIAFIYKSLGCLHSIQPRPDDDGYSSPSIPALKKKGFITWQTIQLLLGPEEHVPFLQNAVSRFDIVDPSTSNTFPKLLPKECFPHHPDPDMIRWYEGVSEKLRKEAEEEEQRNVAGQQAEGGNRTSSEFTGDESADDERAGAARYFRDPMYRNRPRPHIVRRFSRAFPRDFVNDPRRSISTTVRHFWPPWTRRQSLPEQHRDDEAYNDGPTPTQTVPARYVAAPATAQHLSPHRPTHHPHHRPRVYRRSSSLTDTDSDPSDRPRKSPAALRHRRSHEPPASPREYFPSQKVQARGYSTDIRRTDSAAGYGPSKPPPFTVHIGQMQPNGYFERRPVMPSRENYGRSGTVRRYSAQPRDEEPLDRRQSINRYGYDEPRRSSTQRSRSRERERDRGERGERNRELQTKPVHRYVTPVDGVGGRRYPVEAPWR